ncbi:hypothetical protein D9M68_691860 [compost metagenome]
MWNGIVYMKYIQVIVIYYTHQGADQCCLIRRKVKQGVYRHADFVEKDIRSETIDQPDRLLISNKVYIVAFIGQCYTQFCRQHTTPSKRRIAHNTYFHKER